MIENENTVTPNEFANIILDGNDSFKVENETLFITSNEGGSVPANVITLQSIPDEDEGY